jgi:tryptophan-rich sensory protein
MDGVWAVLIPLMIIGIAIASVPIIYAMHHQHRYDMDVKPRWEPPKAAAPTVCPQCSAMILDEEVHIRAVHTMAT